jgi:hypothetical protein
MPTFPVLLFLGIEAAAAGRGVTSTVQRLGSWHTRGKSLGFMPTEKMTILALKKKNVRVVGMGVCLPLRITEVTIGTWGLGPKTYSDLLGDFHYPHSLASLITVITVGVC